MRCKEIPEEGRESVGRIESRTESELSAEWDTY